MRRYRGHAGHFICANRCLFHLHTEVAGFKVSSVGNFRPKLGSTTSDYVGPIETIGSEYYYETMVFCVDDDGKEIAPGRQIDCATYQNETEAELGHELMVQKYEQLTVDQIRAAHREVMK